ncbi:MAG: hypothetical protein WA139_00115 [Candidatus Aenigmatarchaeota archaeon]
MPLFATAANPLQGFAIPDLTSFSRFLSFAPSFNAGDIIFLLLSASITAFIIYAWMKIFHEPPHPAHAFGVALVANLQNFYLPFLLSLALPFLSGFLPAQIIMHLVPLLVWIALIRIFYGSLDFKHAVIIAVLSYGSYIILQGFNVAGIIQAFLPI